LALWDLYEDLFAPLQHKALLKHLYERHEFEDIMGEPRVLKLVGWSRGRPVGLAAITNELDLVPQISPSFLRARYPDEAARQAVYFCIFAFIQPEFQRRTLFPRLVTTMGQLAAQRSGVVVFDVSEYNTSLFGLDGQVRRMAKWFPDAQFGVVDTQRYYAVELPRPMPSADSLDCRIVVDLTA
jgi:hypothetical protein